MSKHQQTGMRGVFVSLVALVGFIAAPAVALGAKGTAKAADCFSVHARFFTSNGIPCRLWVVGTRRVLSVENCESLPEPMERYVAPPGPAFVVIYGDYLVCPLEPDRPGWMRTVTLRTAERLVVEREHPNGPPEVFRVKSTWVSKEPP